MRRHIPKEQKILAYELSCIHGLSDRHTISRIRKTFRDTGEVGHQPVCQGRPCALDGLEFLEGCIERQPDMILSELQEQLREVTCCNNQELVTLAHTGTHYKGSDEEVVTP
ncbi:hypothetical protein SERLA73DRAFT_140417 [Serpula lacrymans var. lacrymans S7.3]|uniref:Uncharacterized protein n=2 Tax=Serpula lacrymans var. lacrymans TaxID=341189 RepID=F8Q587_SERL3|nr:uncharacterized protein SERLADRAFT_395356 [Serpula lacrymans var. lacrymans S7.9]EGN96714.1 hypothetical protein SERLA73DRAFT_140417 [Serpula lacrymans var. lacrymans S7.3]EGO22326.1 hypothetical protein SERLADRAFT_395356 [Serpula lacrymans var. lacrymans S7.9]